MPLVIERVEIPVRAARETLPEFGIVRVLTRGGLEGRGES